MNIYLITFNQCEYDKYDGFVVRAKSTAEVIKIIDKKYPRTDGYIDWSCGYLIENIGKSDKTEAGIILGSFNAG